MLMSFTGGILESVLSSVAGPLVSGFFGQSAASDQANMQFSINQENQALSAEQNRLNREWQSQANELNRSWQSQVNAENRAAAADINAANLANQERTNAQNLAFAREQLQSSEALQREFAQMGLRWKVADATAAGLHPVYALGGSGATFSPSSIVMPFGSTNQVASQGSAPHAEAPRAISSQSVAPDVSSWMARMGQDLGRAISALMDPYQRALQQAELAGRAAATYKDQAQGDYWAGRAKMLQTTQGANPFPPTGPTVQYSGDQTLGTTSQNPSIVGTTDTYQYKADQPTSAASFDNSRTARSHPFWRQYRITKDGFSMLLPAGSEPQEIFEDKPSWFWALVLKHNVEEFGTPWLIEASKRLPFINDSSIAPFNFTVK